MLVNEIDDQWQIDLVDLSFISRVNDDYKFLLTYIVVLTKYARVMPSMEKSVKSLVNAVAYIYTTSKRTPSKIPGDKVKEFVNRNSNNFCKITECASFPRKMTTSKLALWNVSKERSSLKCGDMWTLWMISFLRTTTVNTERY